MIRYGHDRFRRAATTGWHPIVNLRVEQVGTQSKESGETNALVGLGVKSDSVPAVAELDGLIDGPDLAIDDVGHTWIAGGELYAKANQNILARFRWRFEHPHPRTDDDVTDTVRIGDLAWGPLIPAVVERDWNTRRTGSTSD